MKLLRVLTCGHAYVAAKRLFSAAAADVAEIDGFSQSAVKKIK